jgi:hypothetical protein
MTRDARRIGSGSQMRWSASVNRQSKCPPGSKERKNLERILAAYGQPGEKTGVFVGFGYAEGQVGTAVLTGERIDLTLDANLFDQRVTEAVNTGEQTRSEIEFAGVVAHEGAHILDYSLYGHWYPPIVGRIQLEANGFDAQSHVNKVFNNPSIYRLWNPAWANVDVTTQEKLRTEAVRSNAERAAEIGEGRTR